MPVKIFKEKEAEVRKIFDSYSVVNMLTLEDSEKLSVAVSTATNHNETTSTTSDRVYYILQGKLIINDNLVGKKGDMIFIPGNTQYNFKGSFKAIFINSPAFKKENEKITKLN